MEEFITLQNVKLWTIKEGCGNPILFCHGGPGLWDYLKPVSDMIVERACIIRYEQRGCGRSKGNEPYTVESNVEDIEALRKILGIEKLTIVGHSWGANLTLAYALKYPENCKSLIYMCGTGVSNNWNADFKKTWKQRLTEDQIERARILKELLKDKNSYNWNEIDTEYCRLAWSPDFANRSLALEFSSKLLNKKFHPNYEVNDLVWADWNKYILQSDLLERVANLTIPILVISGADDPRPARYMKEFATKLRKSTYLEVGNAGHYPWLENPQAVANAVKDFLDLYKLV